MKTESTTTKEELKIKLDLSKHKGKVYKSLEELKKISILHVK